MSSSCARLELSGATSSSRISRFIEDMSHIHGAASLRARYVKKADGNGGRANVLVLFVRTDKDHLVDRMISFFDKTAQNHLAVMELQKRMPGLFETAPHAAGSIVALPLAVTVSEAAKKVKAPESVALSPASRMLDAALAAFKSADVKASMSSVVLSRGCSGMLLLAGQASYEHDMRLVRRHLGVGTQISEDDFSKRFYSFAVFTGMLSMLFHNRDAALADQQSNGIAKGSAPKPISAADLSAEQRRVIDDGLEFCKLWIAAIARKEDSDQSAHPTGFQSLQGWAIGEMACIAAPLLGYAADYSQKLPASNYGICDLASTLPQHMNNRARAYMNTQLVFNEVNLGRRPG